MDMMCDARGEAGSCFLISEGKRALMKQFCLVFVMMVTVPVTAAIQRSNYTMLNDGMTVINGEIITSQKIKILGKDGDHSNMKMTIGMMPSHDGNNYGFEFVKRNGKAFLNAQLLQNSMDAPKVIASYPCKIASNKYLTDN